MTNPAPEPKKPMDIKAIATELMFLKRYPQFDEKPATIKEFLGDEYLDIEGLVRPGLVDALVHIFGEEINPEKMSAVRRGMFTGAIGIGKTTFASIVIPYMVHWVLCLKNPQKFYNLLPGSRIAFMQMSTSSGQAKEVLFGDIKARIEHSKWFTSRGFSPDPEYRNQLRFAKDIWVLPGNSAETTFEGYNILAGILDEMDSHQLTEQKDYAEAGYDTIHSRIDSRFGANGLLLAIGQMKKGTGFASKKYKELLKDDEAYVIRMTIWESFGWNKYLNDDGTRKSFWYDTKRKAIVSEMYAQLTGTKDFIEIPKIYQKNFENNPEKALRDLAGIPPEAGDPFISLVHKVDEARDRWNVRYDNLGSPVDESPTMPKFAKWFRANNSLKRVIHIDIAYSGNGDAMGLAMAHVPEVVEIDGERKPIIVFDFLMRIKAAPGTEIIIGDIRKIIYRLRDDLGFKIKKVSYDGFESTDSIQQLQKQRIASEKVSIDKSVLPYHDLREAIYDDRIEFPPYMTYLNKGDVDLYEIAIKELLELEDVEKKIDHPPNGSKDLADAMAGCCYSLMGDRQYRRGVSSIDQNRSHERTGTDDYSIITPYDQGPGGFTLPPLPSLEGLINVSHFPTQGIPRGRNDTPRTGR